MVTQDTSLLHRSIAANIRYGKPNASEAEVAAAARKAQAHEFIVALRDWNGRTGYAAHVGERGVKLSGGQRQRIALARVILKDAPILVLDEATSALDSEVELAIQEQLDLMQGKTVIAIAHRLSTIARMDRLVVLEAGKIVEEGTHAELLRFGGHYEKLWRHQSGGFIANELDEPEAPPSRCGPRSARRGARAASDEHRCLRPRPARRSHSGDPERRDRAARRPCSITAARARQHGRLVPRQGRAALPVLGAVADDGTLLGFATYGTFRAWPAYKYTIEHSVYVHKDQRRKGIARALLTRLDRRRRGAGLPRHGGRHRRGQRAEHRAARCSSASRAAGMIHHAGFKFGRWLDLAFYELRLRTPAAPVDG